MYQRFITCVTCLFVLLSAMPAWAVYAVKHNSSSYPLVFFMVDSSDHVTAKTGLSPTITISKAGGSFASASGSVSEIGNGWYKVAGNATDSGTLGPLVLHATGTGADATDAVYEVVAYDPQDSTPAVDVTQVSGDSTSADNAKKFFDGTGYGPLLYRTTVDTPTDNQNFSISAPIASSSLLGCRAILRDVTSTGIMTGVVTGMSGGGDVVVDLDGAAVFTVASGDVVEFLAPAFGGEDRTAATTAQTKIGYLPNATAGATGGVAIVGSNMGTVTGISGVTFPDNFSTLTIANNAVAANVTHWLGTAAATPTVAGVPEVDITKVLGTPASAVSGAIDVNVVKLIGNEIEITPP